MRVCTQRHRPCSADLRETGVSVEFGGGTRTMTPDQINVEALLQSRDYFNTGTQSEFDSTAGVRTENGEATGATRELLSTLFCVDV